MTRQSNDASPTRAVNPLRRVALRSFEAVCEALYPDDACGAPSWRDTDMVARAAELWDELPPMSRLTLEALFAGVAPLAALSPERRCRLLESMRRSRLWPLRTVAEAVKSASTMVYLSHPAALEHIGVLDRCNVAEAPAEVAKRGVFTIAEGRRVAGSRGAS